MCTLSLFSAHHLKTHQDFHHKNSTFKDQKQDLPESKFKLTNRKFVCCQQSFPYSRSLARLQTRYGCLRAAFPPPAISYFWRKIRFCLRYLQFRCRAHELQTQHSFVSHSVYEHSKPPREGEVDEIRAEVFLSLSSIHTANFKGLRRRRCRESLNHLNQHHRRRRRTDLRAQPAPLTGRLTAAALPENRPSGAGRQTAWAGTGGHLCACARPDCDGEENGTPRRRRQRRRDTAFSQCMHQVAVRGIAARERWKGFIHTECD